MTKGSIPDGMCTLSGTELNAALKNLESANVISLNIAEYVQNLPENIRIKIAGFLRSAEIDQDSIDLENIEHYLIVSRYSEQLKNACEAKLLTTVNSTNCFRYLMLSNRFNLTFLSICSRKFCDEFNVSRQTETISDDPGFRKDNEKSTSRNYTSYNALFTCCSEGNGKQALTALVLNANNEVNCYRKIQKGKNISTNFQCCCLQDHEHEPPYMMYSFGKCFWKYDPVLNKCKKLQPMKSSRNNFSLVAHDRKCYAIGGIHKGKVVKNIDEYNPKKKVWKAVAELPTESKCVTAVSDGQVIYIFCSQQCVSDESTNSLTAFVFDPETKEITISANIDISAGQVKACMCNGRIYLACDSGDLVNFDLKIKSFLRCPPQTLRCKDFGMFTDGNDIFLVGGKNVDGKCNDLIRRFCISENNWRREGKISECLPFYGTCEVKIPNMYTIVPFYESHVFGK